MSEFFNIPYNGESLECRPDNTTAFLFRAIGQQALRNHIFVVLGKEDEQLRGVYIFKNETNNEFDKVINHMTNTGYTVHMNIQEVPDTDEKVYQGWLDDRVKASSADLGDYIPDNFE